jgi:ABC-type glycerol-3-phosphate transport system substrate-binding protein
MHWHFQKSGLILIALTVWLQPLRAEKVVLQYWDKWTGHEGAKMLEIVDDFNASQNRIEVRYSPISQIDVKVMLAVAGRRPPDVAGLWASRLPNYVENNALLPLDKLAARVGIKEQDYLPSIWKLCHHRGPLWGLPTTSYTLALNWNKRLFREAGLNPEQGPRTIAELEQFNEKLTRLKPKGKGYQTFGFLPLEPAICISTWGYWFGGRLWDGEGRITATEVGNRRYLEWIESYPKRFGVREVSAFLEGSGAMASSLNPFIDGRVAMEFNGPWVSNFIEKFATGPFELGVGAFPTWTGTGPPVALIETDILTIPRGSPHPREAMEFLCYVNRPEVIEKFCTMHHVFSPRAQVSDNFWKHHPNPCIRTFYQLAESPGVVPMPRMPVWTQYDHEMDRVTREVWAQRATPKAALESLQERMQMQLERRADRWKNVSSELEKFWVEEEKGL